MSSQPVDHQHPVVDFARRLHSRLDSLADVPLMAMSPSEKREVLLQLAQSSAQLEMLRLRLLVETGFMSNAREGALLRSHAYQWRVARGLADGVAAFVPLRG